MIIVPLLLVSSMMMGGAALAQDDPSPLKFPVPKDIKNQLFYIQRDPNINTIICQLNADDSGKLDSKNPINVFWIRYGDKGEKKDLNFIQRKFAYGVETKNLGNGKYELKFAARKTLPMYLMKSPLDKKYHVYVTVNNKTVIVDRIFLRIDGGTFWFPNVKYIEFKGTMSNDLAKPAIERIKV